MKRQIILFVLALFSILVFCGSVSAADNSTSLVNITQSENPDPSLTIVKGSNDAVMGLDSNNVNDGPDQTLIQFRVTNPDTVNTAHSVTATLSWTSSNTYVNLAPTQSATVNLDDIAPGVTKDVFYLVEITRNAAAYDTSRNYQVTIAGTDTPTYTPTGSLYVSKLLSQNRNSVTGITVSNTHPQVGDTITVTVTSQTAATNYNLVSLPLIEYNASMLRPLGMTTTYTDTGGVVRTTNNIYIPTPNSNAFTSTWTILVTSANISEIYGIIMDHSGSKYHYNADYGTNIVSTYVPASVGNLVWDDLNANGMYDTGEPGIPNVLVALYDTTNTQLGTRTTDASGYFYFTELYPQSYYLKFTTPTGYYISPLYGSGYDNKANPTTGQTATFTLSPGENNYNWDAGMYKYATVGNFVWNDLNADGIYAGIGYGLAGVTVTLYRSDSIVVGTTTTNSEGYYDFYNLLPGSYYLHFTKPDSSWYFSPYMDGGDYRNKVTDQNGYTNTFTLISGQIDLTQDAGLYQKGSIGNFVWEDTNANGIWETGEPGIENVLVTLYYADGTPTGLTDTTDTSGNYLFENLTPADYYVHFTKPTGWNFSPAFQGTDDEIDSDAYPTTGNTPTITLTSGQNQLKWDAGLYQYANMGNFVWMDLNLDGIYDPETEDPLSNIVVRLYNSSNVHLESTTTDANGNYYFSNIVPGSYYLEFVKPTGYQISTNYGSGYDNKANPTTGLTATTTLTSGESQLTWWAGMLGPELYYAQLGNFVWDDQNADGIYQGRGGGIQGITVNLYLENDLNTPIATTTTDIHGFYNFYDLTPTQYVPGNYRYVLKFELPDGYIFSPYVAGGDYTNKVHYIETGPPTMGRTDPITLAIGQTDITWDAAMYKNGSIGNFVWEDTNANGIWETGELGIENVLVTLYYADGTPTGLTDTTDTSGNYLFENLTPADYYVHFTKPTGWNFSPAFQGTDDEIDSDAYPTTGNTPTITLTSGGNQLKWDAGLYQYATIGDTVWDDLNANGNIDSGEPGISNVMVRLYNSSNVHLESTTTDSNGNYYFSNLMPGSYYLEFVKPTGYNISTNYGSGYDNKANPTTGLTATTTLTSGESQLTWDAGMWQPASIGNWVWDDQNADGIYQGRGWGLDGVTVELYDEDGLTLIATDTTENNGFYSFSNLEPGTYIVQFTLLSGYNFSPYVDLENSISNKVKYPATGRTDPITVTSGANKQYIDAAMYQPVAVGSLVWTDLNFDGILDAGDPGLAGVTVELHNGLTGALIDTTITNSNGNYIFEDLTPDFYYVKFILASGYTFSPQYAVEDPALNSSANPVNGETVSREYTSGVEYMYVNAGAYGTADVSMTKTTDNENPNVLQQFTYTITITNSGPLDATNVQVNDVIPLDLFYFNSYYAEQGYYLDDVWHVGTLAKDATLRLELRLSPRLEAAGQTIYNTATETQNEYDPTPATATSHVNVPVSADIAVNTSFQPAACPGQAWPPINNQIILTFITVTNNGPDNATGVQITDNLPSTITYMDYSLSTDGGITWTISKYLPPDTYNSTSGIWNIGNLNSGSTIILILRGRINATTGTILTNNAHKTAENEYDWDPSNDSSTTNVTVA